MKCFQSVVERMERLGVMVQPRRQRAQCVEVMTAFQPRHFRVQRGSFSRESIPLLAQRPFVVARFGHGRTIPILPRLRSLINATAAFSDISAANHFLARLLQ